MSGTKSRTYKHGDVLQYDPISDPLPETIIGRDQFLWSVPGKGLVVQDVYHPDNKPYRVTARSIGLLDDGRTD